MRTPSATRPLGHRFAALAAALSLSASAWAQLITPNPGLPPLPPELPPEGGYLTAAEVHAIYGNSALLQIILNRALHRPIALENRQNNGPDEIETFMSTLDGTGDIIQGGNPIAVGIPVSASGLVQTVVFGKVGNVTGTFDTEMLSMSLSGVTPLGPFMIRESPTLPSLGKTSITDIGGGLYRIDSFFDVFTELSIDGGATWIPDANGPARVNLVVPEPGSLGLLAAGGLGLCLFRRRR